MFASFVCKCGHGWPLFDFRDQGRSQESGSADMDVRFLIFAIKDDRENMHRREACAKALSKSADQNVCRSIFAFVDERKSNTLAQAAAAVVNRNDREDRAVQPDILAGSSAWQQGFMRVPARESGLSCPHFLQKASADAAKRSPAGL